MCGDKCSTDNETNSAAWIVDHTDEIVSILTRHPKAAKKRKPRSDIGTKRKAKGEVAQEGEK